MRYKKRRLTAIYLSPVLQRQRAGLQPRLTLPPQAENSATSSEKRLARPKCKPEGGKKRGFFAPLSMTAVSLDVNDDCQEKQGHAINCDEDPEGDEDSTDYAWKLETQGEDCGRGELEQPACCTPTVGALF